MLEGTLAIIQPTSFCNIDCKYCYVSGRSIKKQMTIETLDRIFSGVLESKYTRDTVVFCYHAGEPLVMPKSYYRKATELLLHHCERLNRNAKQAIQTNAILIDNEWIEIFRAANMEIGVSIDGPAFIHNANRVTRSGKSTHDSVMKGVKLLQDAGLSFTVIMVLTTEGLDYADEIYDFFVENGIKSVGFNIDEFGANSHVSSFSATDSKYMEIIERYRNFMKRLLFRIDQDGGKLVVREFAKFASIAAKRASGEKEIINGVIVPLDILSFDMEGNYITFSPELISANSERFGDLFMGNIAIQPVDGIFSNEKYLNIKQEIQRGVSLCKSTCKYWTFCGGGSPADKFFETGRFDVSETIACKVHMQELVDVFLDFMVAKISR